MDVSFTLPDSTLNTRLIVLCVSFAQQTRATDVLCRDVCVCTSSIFILLRVNRSMTYPLAIFSSRLSCSKRRYSSDTYAECTKIWFRV